MKYLWRRLVALTLGLGLTSAVLAGSAPAAPPPVRWGPAPAGQTAPAQATLPQSPYAQQTPGWQPVSHQQVQYQQPAPAVTLARPVPLPDEGPVPSPLPNGLPLHDAALQPARFTSPGDGRPPLLRPDTGQMSPGMFNWKPTSATENKQPETKGTETGPMPKADPLPNPAPVAAPVTSLPLPVHPLPIQAGPGPGYIGSPVVGAPLMSGPAPVVSMPSGPIGAPFMGAPVGPPMVPPPMGIAPVPMHPAQMHPAQACPPGGCPPVAAQSCGVGMPCGTTAAAPVFPVDGASPCYTPWNTFYVSAEYLMWWTSGASTPPLVSTGPVNFNAANLGVPGGIGRNGTVILHGNEDVLDGMRSGFRISSGLWLDESRCFGVDGSFFFLGEAKDNFFAFSSGNPALSRPLRFNLDNGSVVEGVQVTALSGLASGSVSVNHSSELWGGDVNFRTNLFCTPTCFVDFLLGYRMTTLNDVTQITEVVDGIRATPAGPIRGSFLLNDYFEAKNQFYGGQVGLAAEHHLGGRWTLDWRAKIAMGTTRQRVNIRGSTVISGTGTAADGTYDEGVLALGSNSGSYSRNVFSVIPEVQANLGYSFSQNLRGFVGYNFMYWSNVARASEQIDRNVNPNLLAPPVGGGPAVPAFNWNSSGFWAQGINFGLEYRW